MRRISSSAGSWLLVAVTAGKGHFRGFFPGCSVLPSLPLCIYGGSSLVWGAGWWRTSVFFRRTCSPKAGSDTVQSSLSVGNWGSVICKKWFLYQLLKYLCVGLQPSKIERLPSRPNLMWTNSSSSRSSVACLSIMLKKIEKRVGAKTTWGMAQISHWWDEFDRAGLHVV